MDVISATDASSVLVKYFGLFKMLEFAYWMDGHCFFLKKVWCNNQSPEESRLFLRNELKWKEVKEVK